MVLFRNPPTWQLPQRTVTSETAYFNRRRFLKTFVGAGVGLATANLAGCQGNAKATNLEQSINTRRIRDFNTNPDFAQVDRPITDQLLAGQYNNFYEFGGSKSIWNAAQALPTEDWKVEVGGLVANPRTYDIDQLKQEFPLEERIYRFRCVEAWSMVLPWIGFPMARLLEAAQPNSQAKYVRFTSYYDPEVTPGPGLFAAFYPWPYTEALSIEEMANELAFFAVGIYGHDLPKQHGAPLRMVVPWKYGFKGAKSIVKIEFTEEKPTTFWNTIQPNEYKFVSNVEPDVPHPRWSQAQERFISAGPDLSWEIRPTLPYNGYEEYVGHLYS
jgi:sulfoxide reductase catalytic subunit YedY